MIFYDTIGISSAPLQMSYLQYLLHSASKSFRPFFRPVKHHPGFKAGPSEHSTQVQAVSFFGLSSCSPSLRHISFFKCSVS